MGFYRTLSPPKTIFDQTPLKTPLLRPTKRRVCAFCNDDTESGPAGPFIGPHPFIAGTNKMKKSGVGRRKTFWAHDACARFSPEVYFSKDTGDWFNVYRAVRRSRTMVRERRFWPNPRKQF